MTSASKKDFEQLYVDYNHKVYRLCLGYLKGDSSLAADLVQEVFIKVLRNWDGFKGKSERSTWLFRIAVNTCLTELRNNKKFKKVPLEEWTEKSEEPADPPAESDIAQLHACINKLNSVNKSIILLELEQLPQQEIASIIGISHTAIRTRINRIKNQLSKCILHENTGRNNSRVD